MIGSGKSHCSRLGPLSGVRRLPRSLVIFTYKHSVFFLLWPSSRHYSYSDENAFRDSGYWMMGRHSVLRVRWCVLRRAFSDAESGVKAGTNGTTIKRYWFPMILYTGGIGSRLPFGFFFFATTEYPFWKRSGVFVARERVVNRFSFFLAFFFCFPHLDGRCHGRYS